MSVVSPQFIYGTAWKEQRTAALVEAALRAGFRAIDTANQRKHYFEAAVGEALRAAYDAGVVTRAELFLQTKFTYVNGQDHRLPYDPRASFAEQVRQSLASSLEHLGADYVDSFVLHGPASGYGWSEADAEVWHAMRDEQALGRARTLGVSNVSPQHLQQMIASRGSTNGEAPAYVQNRCFARLAWDGEVRRLCREHGIVYQGFSLLTANVEVLRHSLVASIAEILRATPAQIVFAFARQIGILPLTGTSDPEHMRQDLASLGISLPTEAVEQLELMFR